MPVNDEHNIEEKPLIDEGSCYPDFSHVSVPARIACYDDMRSAPRITEIQPADTAQYIENLASQVYDQANKAGGSIPYTVIREVTENFIHARFNEIIVSILDGGNTIRFADQGPGIADKEKAQRPGFSSAVEPMKHYIRGVGSGLPIVREYLDYSHGSIQIEDNLGTGAVVTISMNSPERLTRETAHQTMGIPNHPQLLSPETPRPTTIIPPLSQHGRRFLPFLLSEGELGITELSNLTGIAHSSTYAALQKLEEAGLVKKVGKKRVLTEFGQQVAQAL